jgi:predicted methyltransferase
MPHMTRRFHWPTGLRHALVLAAVMTLGACANMDTAVPPLSRERIAEIVNSPDRSAADRSNDLRRKPVDMLAFIGIRPGMVALDLSTGGGVLCP